MATKYPLPAKNIGKTGGALKPSPSEFASRVCCAIAEHCPHIKSIEKISGSIVALDSTGSTVFTCPLPGSNFSWNPVTCVLTLVDGDNDATVVDLAEVLKKARDDLEFNVNTCIMSWSPVDPERDPKSFNLSTILDKLKDRLKFDEATCDLVLSHSSGDPNLECRLPLIAILNKLPALEATLTQACTLELGFGEDIAADVDLLPLLGKIELTNDEEACVFEINIPGQNCFKLDYSVVIDKIKTAVVFDEEKCSLKVTSPDGMTCDTYDIGAAILAKQDPRCCHYQVSSNTDIDPNSPPSSPPGAPGGANKDDGDTVHVCHNNGSCFYTCIAGNWSLDFCKVSASDCCTYFEQGAVYDPANPVQPSKSAANDGDTLIVKSSPNLQGTSALSFFTCVNGAWSPDFVCEIEKGCCTSAAITGIYDQTTVEIGPSKAPTVAEGDTLFAKTTPNAAGVSSISQFTCRNGAWAHEWTCELRQGCCTYHGVSQTTIDPAAPPTAPAGSYPQKANGDTVIECHPNGFSAYTCDAGSWSLDFVKVDCCSYHATSTTPVDPINPPDNPVIPGAVKTPGNTATIRHPNAVCFYTCTDAGWIADFCIRDGCCHFQSVSTTDFDPANPPATATAQPGAQTKQEGDTLHVCHPNGSCYYTCNSAGEFALDFCKLANRDEVFVGLDEPDKDAGILVWFDPVNCILRLCDNAGGWREPRTVVCSTDQPPTDKGGAQLWFNMTDSCLYILCDETWISSGNAAVQQFISTLCISIGGGRAQPVPVADGKVVIPIPAPSAECCTYPLESNETLEEGVQPGLVGAPLDKNENDTALQKHPNGFSVWTCGSGGWAMDWLCVFPDPDPPVKYSIRDKAGNELPASVSTDADGVVCVVLNLPPILATGPDTPAIDGTEGCLWFDKSTGCLSALCDGMWISPTELTTQK